MEKKGQADIRYVSSPFPFVLDSDAERFFQLLEARISTGNSLVDRLRTYCVVEKVAAPMQTIHLGALNIR